MVIAQQKQQNYIDRTKVQALTYKIKDKVWLMLKNRTTAIENKKLDAKQTKYTILENMGFHNFRFNTPPNIRNVFHVDKLRAVSKDRLFSQVSDDNHPNPSIINNENGTHEYDVERDLKEKKGPRLPIFGEMEKLYSFYLGTSVNYGKHRYIK